MKNGKPKQTVMEFVNAMLGNKEAMVQIEESCKDTGIEPLDFIIHRATLNSNSGILNSIRNLDWPSACHITSFCAITSDMTMPDVMDALLEFMPIAMNCGIKGSYTHLEAIARKQVIKEFANAHNVQPPGSTQGGNAADATLQFFNIPKGSRVN